jgi:hypothetical protein
MFSSPWFPGSNEKDGGYGIDSGYSPAIVLPYIFQESQLNTAIFENDLTLASPWQVDNNLVASPHLDQPTAQINLLITPKKYLT